jgi:class 3 adenylate cyclase
VRDALARVEAGDLDARVPVFDGSDLGLLQAGFNRMSDGLREREELRDLFGRHVGEDVARAAQERGVELGGEERDVTVLFADLQGFTAFSERHTPAEVLSMLNEYWAKTVPVVLGEHGGMIERFAGDAIMVVFNAAIDHPDHPLRAARAGLALQHAAEELAADGRGRPRFRVGINTGPAIVGNVGTAEQRSFTAIGDTTNLAARLQTHAQPGEVVIGQATFEALAGNAEAVALGPFEVKGKTDPVAAYVLSGLR